MGYCIYHYYYYLLALNDVVYFATNLSAKQKGQYSSPFLQLCIALCIPIETTKVQ